MRLYLLHNDSCANRNEVTAVIVREGETVHLVLESASCIIYAPVQRGNSHSSGDNTVTRTLRLRACSYASFP